MHHVDDQLRRQVPLWAADVIVAKERSHDLCHVFVDTGLREEVLAPQHPPTTHADQVHTGTARVDERGNHVDVTGAAFHALLVLDTAQQGDLVAQFGSLFEIQGAGGLLHGSRELIGERIAAPFQEHHRVPHILGVLRRFHQAHTGRLAALDLVLQARPCAVLVEAVFALAHKKGFLQQAQAFTNRPGAGVRPEVLALLLFCPAVNAQARKVAVR